MAIPFLNNISLTNNEIQNVRLHNTGSAPNNSAGQIYFNTVDSLAKYYSNATDQWVSLKEYSFSNATYINVSTSGTPIKPSISFNLSAVDGTAAVGERYLTKNNTWAEVSAIPGTYSWVLAGNTGTAQTINSGDTASIVGTGVITTVASATDTITITHSNVARADTATTASPAFGGTFTAVDEVTSNAQGHITAINLKTVTLPTPNPDTNTTYTLPVAAGAANTAIINLTAGGSGSGVADSVTFSGTTNEIEVTETVGNNGTIVIGLPNNVTVTGNLTVSGTGQSSFGGQVTVPSTPAAVTDAASKGYVDQSNAGQSVFQGGYNAATNTPDLDVAPSALIKKGWFWAVTDTGVFFAETVQPGDLLYANIDNPGATFANWVVVQSGQDIAGEGASDGATVKGIAGFNSAHFNVTANGWVSSDIYTGGSNLGIVPSGGVNTTFLRGDGTWVIPTNTTYNAATSTVLGLVELFSNTVQTVPANAVSTTASRTYGVQFNSSNQMVVNVPWVDTAPVTSVSASAINNRLGLAITPTTGAVVAGLSIDTLADITTTTVSTDSLPIYDLSATTNKRVTVANLSAVVSTLNSFTNTGPAVAGTSYTIAAATHGLGTNSSIIMVQLVLVSTGETIYADVIRGASGLITIEFAASQAINTVRALLQKIG